MNAELLKIKKPTSLPEGLELRRGAGSTIAEGMCVMQATAWLAGEIDKHGHLTDSPECACRVVRRFVIRCNDDWSKENRQKLIAIIPLLIGSRASPEVESKRGFYFADFAVRTMLPWLCDKAKKPELAAKLRALTPVADRATAELARQEARSARDVLRSAAYAAYAAAYDAAAAYAAAAYAAADAAAAYAAAADAAADAAAAYAAADAAAAYAADAYAAADAAAAYAAADAAAAYAADAYAAADAADAYAAADAAAKSEIADMCILAIKGALAIGAVAPVANKVRSASRKK